MGEDEVGTLLASIAFWADAKAKAVRECRFDDANAIQAKIDKRWAKVKALVDGASERYKGED